MQVPDAKQVNIFLKIKKHGKKQRSRLFAQPVRAAQSLLTSFVVQGAIPELHSETEAALPGLAFQQLLSGNGNSNTDTNGVMQVSLSLSEWESIIVSGLFAWNLMSVVVPCKSHI